MECNQNKKASSTECGASTSRCGQLPPVLSLLHYLASKSERTSQLKQYYPCTSLATGSRHLREYGVLLRFNFLIASYRSTMLFPLVPISQRDSTGIEMCFIIKLKCCIRRILFIARPIHKLLLYHPWPYRLFRTFVWRLQRNRSTR
jgi:hypothetical protein